MKKIIAILAAFVAVSLLLSSCAILGGGDTGGGKGEGINPDYIYGSGVTTSVVVSTSDVNLTVNEVLDALYEATGVNAVLKNDTLQMDTNEIVIGATTRDISQKAKAEYEKALNKKLRDDPDEDEKRRDAAGYTVYAEGGHLALVWSDDEVKDLAIEYLVSEYLGGRSLSSKTISDTKFYSISELRREREEIMKSDSWKKLESDFLGIGCSAADAAAATSAVKRFYSIVDDRVYLWLANLYDPEIGGFYYSNSGRDTEGFLPDIESTFQAINFLDAMGLFMDFSTDKKVRINKALSEEMKTKLVNFVLERQSSYDGYFYHPQWETVGISRYSRDLSWALGILDWFDAKPLYDISGYKGTLGAPSGKVSATGKFVRLPVGSSVSFAVSRAVAVDDTIPAHLRTLDAFNEYLNTFDMKNKSYSAGNEIGVQSIQIRNRGEEYVKAVEDFFNKHQNSENGLWEDGIYYASVNGLMKICAAMNSFGIELNYPEKAFASALKMAKHEGPDLQGLSSGHIVDVYNPWYAMDDVLQNVEKHGDKATADRLRASLASEASSLIEVSMNKTVLFKKEDGSFGYNIGSSPPTSQGAPVAVPGAVEGDVNGGTMAVNGVINNMMAVFGISAPRRFYRSDYEVFRHEIDNLSPVVKSNVGIEAEPITFEGDAVGSSEPMELNSASATGGSITVAIDPKNPDNHVLNVCDSSRSGGTSFRFSAGGVPVGASRLVLEWDMLVNSSGSGLLYQIWMGSSYMLTLTAKGDEIILGDASSNSGSNIVTTDLGVSFPKGEWTNIRVEFFYTDDASTVRTKVYINDLLRAVSTNFYGNSTLGGRKPTLSYPDAHFYTLFDSLLDVCFDNFFANKDNVIYKEEPVVNPDRVADFEDDEIGAPPAKLTGTADAPGTVVVKEAPKTSSATDAAGKALYIDAVYGAGIAKSAASLVLDGNAFAFETDIYVKSASSTGDITQMRFKAAGGNIISFALVGGDEYLTLREYSDPKTENGTSSTELGRIKIGKWSKLRIEYYRFQYDMDEESGLWNGAAVRVFVDGEETFNGYCSYDSTHLLPEMSTEFHMQVLRAARLECYLDNLIYEVIEKPYVNADGTELADPENPEFPRGGDPVTTPATDTHDGFFDFEDSELGGSVAEGLETSPNSAVYGNHITVVKDETDKNGTSVLKYQTNVGGTVGNSAKFEASRISPADANCNVLEFDFRMEDPRDWEYIQLHMINSSGATFARFNLCYRTTGDKLGIIVTSVGGSFEAVIADTDGWLNFRVEYYNETGKAKFYSGDSYLGEGRVTMNELPTAQTLARVSIAALKDTGMDLYLDNVTVAAVKKTYVAGE